MTYDHIGWVADQGTATRRIHVYDVDEGGVALAVEVDGQTHGLVTLDAEGVVMLFEHIVRAVVLTPVPKERG